MDILGRRIWSLIFDFILHFIGNFLLLDILFIIRNSYSCDFLFRFIRGKGRIDRKCGQVFFCWYQSKNSYVSFQVFTAKSVEIHWKQKTKTIQKHFFSKHVFFFNKTLRASKMAAIIIKIGVVCYFPIQLFDFIYFRLSWRIKQ